MTENSSLTASVIRAHCEARGVACLGVELDNSVWVIQVAQAPAAQLLLELGTTLKTLGARWVAVEVSDGN
jgi:hypothetical protein